MRKYDMVKDFQAVGDGVADDSAVFQKAFSSLTAGDELCIPAGTFLTGPISLSTSGVTITLEKGCVVKLVDDERRFPPVETRWEGVFCYCLHPCVQIHDCTDVLFRGEGTIDGSGKLWWEKAVAKKQQNKPVSEVEKQLAALNPGYERQGGGGGGRKSQFLRPCLFELLRTDHVTVEGITLKDSPFWTLHPLLSRNLLIKEVTIKNPADAPNTDGIDVDSSEHVEIASCKVHVGDDGIALKSGIGDDAIRIGVPTSFVYIHDCMVKSAHGGAVIGSETGAGIHDVKVENCLFDGTDRGIRIKTRRGRAGFITSLSFKHITMHNVLCPITVNMYYVCGSNDPSLFSLDAQKVINTTPKITDVTIEDIKADGIRSSCGFIVGLPESPIEGLSIKHCSFSMDKELVSTDLSEMYGGLPHQEKRGIRLRNATVSFSDIHGAELDVDDGVTIEQ